MKAEISSEVVLKTNTNFENGVIDLNEYASPQRVFDAVLEKLRAIANGDEVDLTFDNAIFIQDFNSAVLRLCRDADGLMTLDPLVSTKLREFTKQAFDGPRFSDGQAQLLVDLLVKVNTLSRDFRRLEVTYDQRHTIR